MCKPYRLSVILTMDLKFSVKFFVKDLPLSTLLTLTLHQSTCYLSVVVRGDEEVWRPFFVLQQVSRIEKSRDGLR